MTTFSKHKNDFELIEELENMETKIQIFKHKEIYLPKVVIEILKEYFGNDYVRPCEFEYVAKWGARNPDMGCFDACAAQRTLGKAKRIEFYINAILYPGYTERQNKQYSDCFKYPPVKRLAVHYDHGKDLITDDERKAYNEAIAVLEKETPENVLH